MLAGANVPFTGDQERAIVLMMEDRRQASEELFGDLLDCRAGPTQGQDEDRLRSAIGWMRNEFLEQLQTFLTPEQNAVWRRFLDAQAKEAAEAAGPPRQQQQTQYVRINSNAFTAEDDEYERGGGGRGTEIIQRGGIGAFHGNAELMLKDEALNARNPLAHNKPPYREHQTSFDFGGPVIPRRLTANLFFSHNKAENVDTIHATLPEGLFDLGIVRPTTNQEIGSRGTYQLSTRIRWPTTSASKPSRGATRMSAASRCPSAPASPTKANGESRSSSSRRCLRHRCSRPGSPSRAPGRRRSLSAMPSKSTCWMRSGAEARRTDPRARNVTTASAACIRVWARK